jgi:xanthine dehydrogenase large subunit
MKNSRPNTSSISHVKGISKFVDDHVASPGELFIGIVRGPNVPAKILSMDFSKAVSEKDGVLYSFTGHDFHCNSWGPITSDQPLLAIDKTEYAGEPIGLLAGYDRLKVKEALLRVNVKWKKLKPVLCIDESLKKEMFLGVPQKIQRGDFNETLNSSDCTISDTMTIGGQEHFYLESQSVIAFPDDRDCLKVLSSSQHPTEVQHVVARSLGMKQHQVVCVVERMGGAFGGKESQASMFAAFAGLVASRTQRPARLVLDCDEDFGITGKRHPYRVDYTVAFSRTGKINGFSADFYSNGGAYLDLSPAILQRTLLHAENSYFIPNVSLSGRICKTNTAPNTAFRGFGGPQGSAVIENIMEEISLKLNIDSLEIRKKNLYGLGKDNTTPYGQEVQNNMLPEIFSRLSKSSDYIKRSKEIKEQNLIYSRYIKGISLTPVKFGISFTNKILNQGSALVNVHLDGTIQVSTGATEMGQGVYTKIQQLVAEFFDIPFEDVRVMSTSTEKNHNTSATAASSGFDINGSAALIACEKIKQRMQEVRREFEESNPTSTTLTFSELALKCFEKRVSLGDHGFYKTKGIGFDVTKGSGSPFYYFTFGAAVSEVQVDRFTGEIKVLRSDILMDLGRQINESIDKGQVSGAFIQSLGWVSSENLHYNDDGQLLTNGPTTYKIPSIQDIPRVFNIDFIENNNNTKNVRGNKAVGEPPFVLGLSVWCAIKSAIESSTCNGFTSLPATNERIVTFLSEGLK